MNNPTPSGTLPTVEGIVSRPSPFPVQETLERLKAAIGGRNLTLFAQIDHSDLARGVGLTMQEAHVLISRTTLPQRLQKRERTPSTRLIRKAW